MPNSRYSQRLEAERRWRGERAAANPKPGYCCAYVKLGTGWVSKHFQVFCGNKAQEGSVFCGSHAHIPEAWGATIRRLE